MSEKAMAPHSSTPAWKIPWMEEPGRLWSMRSLRVRHDWMTSLSRFTFTHWRRKLPPTPVLSPGKPQGRQSLVGCLYGVAQSWTRLKWLSSCSRRMCTLILLQELQTYNSLLKNHWQKNVGSHQKKIPHVQGQRRSPNKMVGGQNCI